MQVKEKITLTQRNGKLEGIQSFSTSPYMNHDYLGRTESRNPFCYRCYMHNGKKRRGIFKWA